MPSPRCVADDTIFGDRACTTGVLNLTKNCTCGFSTGTSSNCGTSTVVCADTTVIDVTCLSEATERLTDCTCVTPLHIDHLVEAQTTARMRLPRQSATANGATTPGFSGPFPLHSGVFGPPPLFCTLQSTLVREYSDCWQFRPRSLWVASPGVLSQPPWLLGRFSGRRPFARSAIARDR